jgi:hypothetical protein
MVPTDHHAAQQLFSHRAIDILAACLQVLHHVELQLLIS